jgi:hypothetical protein
MKLSKLIAGCVLAGVLMLAKNAAADKSVAPVRAEPAKSTIPVQVKYADLKGEGENVQAKIVLPARLRDAAAAKSGKVGMNEGVAPTQRSLIAAMALALAAVSVVFVLRGKQVSTASKAVVLGVVGLLGLYGAAFGDAAPMPAPKPTLIVIEFSADATEAILTLPAK